MAEGLEASSSFKDFRQSMQDFLAQERREIKAAQKAQDVFLAELRADLRELRAEVKAGFTEVRADMKASFDRMDRRLETYEDVQKLKEEMAEKRGERRTSGPSLLPRG